MSSKLNIERGDHVFVNGICHLPYLLARIQDGYCFIQNGDEGTVIGITAKGDKFAIEFDKPIWSLKPGTAERSSYDNGCHGKGKWGHCAYIPVEFCNLLPNAPKSDMTDLIAVLKKRL